MNGKRSINTLILLEFIYSYAHYYGPKTTLTTCNEIKNKNILKEWKRAGLNTLVRKIDKVTVASINQIKIAGLNDFLLKEPRIHNTLH